VQVGVGAAAAAGGSVALANDDVLHPGQYPWSHDGMTAGFDRQSIRRGYQVYRGVCATCHSLNRIAWRNMQDVCYDEEELKDMAAEVEYAEPPDSEGNVEVRPGKLFDFMPAPYENEAAARGANGGALPPDLSLIVKSRHDGANYVFSLMTGFEDDEDCLEAHNIAQVREVAAGVDIAPGQHYNPYFPGGKIAMARPLQDGQVEYDDGTPATTSQMAKDVSTFLNWCAEPEHDERKKMGLKWLFALTLLGGTLGYQKRFRWSLYKGRSLKFK